MAIEHPRRRWNRTGLALCLIGLCAAALAAGAATSPTGGGPPTSAPADAPQSDLDYWLSRSAPADTQPATQPTPAASPLVGDDAAGRDALPGVLVLSDGRILAGWVYTTFEQPYLVYHQATKRWRQLPFITVLSITATVIDEQMVPEWRWKEMGAPERVYTGRQYPTRRLEWTFHLIDDTYLTGTVKGQGLWLEHAGVKHGPFVLHERSKGSADQTLEDLVYVKRVLVSRRLMESVLAGHPAPPGRP